MFRNKLICGDNLQILAAMESESMDLIYIDPPFFSNKNYEIVWGDEAEVRSFVDRWQGGINVYLDWLKQRVMELYRVLKKTGSFYLHCDWHAGHYIKVMCDDIFGYKNFQNEIIWHYDYGARSKRAFGSKHDTIFCYHKSSNYTFNKDDILIPFKSKMTEWRYTKGGQKGKPIPKGKIPSDVWDIKLNAMSKERLGYPTQKPKELLNRIIEASSNSGDIVLDAFCGCGTALASAEKLGRYWIGIDISPSAISLIKKVRLHKMGLNESDIDIIGMPQKISDVKKFKPYEFQYWVINELHGSGSPKKSGDMGIDGFSFLEHAPIQVKQSEHIGRNVIDNFETALKRHYINGRRDMKGYIIAFSFSKGAYEEIARAKKDNFEIQLLTVQDILDKKLKIGYQKNLELK